MKISKKTLIGLLMILPVITLAAPPTGGVPQVPVDEPQDILDIINNLVTWAGAIFFAVAAFFFFWAGYLYLRSGGDEKTLGEAKNYLIYSLIGIAVGLLAFSATRIVENLLG